MGPILSSDSAGVYQVREVVFGVRDYDVRVADGVVVAAPHRLSGGRRPGRSLCRVDGRLAAGQTDKAFVEAIEPRAQDAWLVARRSPTTSRETTSATQFGDQGGVMLAPPGLRARPGRQKPHVPGFGSSILAESP